MKKEPMLLYNEMNHPPTLKIVLDDSECGSIFLYGPKATYIYDLLKDDLPSAVKLESGEKIEFDSVFHPSHYCEGRQYEPRKVIEDWELGFYLGNVVKYVSRAGRKGNALNDLKKAQQYLAWEIERLEKEG